MSGQKKKSIIVGTFGENGANSKVPPAFIGNKIWYSEEKKIFLITDDNNQTRNRSFDMKRFRSFVDSDVIIFTSSGVEAYMLQLLEEYEAEQEQQFVDPFAQGDGYDQDPYAQDGQYPNQYDPYYDDQPQERRRRSNRQDDHPNNLTEDKAATQKDPTKHMGVFMALTLIFAVIAVVVINFGEPILQAVAPLLS